MGYTIRIDQELCISSGKCVADLPGVFQFDGDELAEVAADREPVEDARLLSAARNCPGRAILLLDDSGSEVQL